MPRPNTLEARLGADALIDIARRYFGRKATSKELAEQYEFHRQAVPRLAMIGKTLESTNEKGPAASTD